MKTLFCLVLSICFPLLALAQNDSLPETRYYSSMGDTVSKEKASYYMVAKFNPWGGVEGGYTKYYMNGQKKEQKIMGAAKVDDRILRWHKNGQQESVLVPNNLLSNEPYLPVTFQETWPVEAYWGEDGKAMVEQGKGFFQAFDSMRSLTEQGTYDSTYKHGRWEGFANDTLQYEEFYEKGKLVGGKQLVNGQYVEYSTLFIYAEPPGGYKGFYTFVSQKIKYPPTAMDNEVQGKVEVAFTVNKDGTFSDVFIKKGIGYGCDQEVLRLMGLAPKWKPAIARARPVRQKMVLPVTFKIE